MIPFLPPRLRVPSLALLAFIALQGAAGAQKIPADMVVTQRCPNDGLQPRIAEGELTGVEGRMHVVYLQGELEAGDLYCVSSTDEGRTFSEPVRVNSQPGNVDAHAAIRGARIALGASGRLYVVWSGVNEATEEEGAGEEQERRALWFTRSDGAGGFEPERRLGGETHALDSAPTVVEGKDLLFVFWHEPLFHDLSMDGPSPAGAAVANGPSDELPARVIYMARSFDHGETFEPPVPVSTEGFSVNPRCAMGSGVQEDGTIYVAYQGMQGTKLDWRVLMSRNGGESFRNRFMDNWGIPRKISTSASLNQGNKALLVAYEAYGKVWFSRIEPTKRKPLMPYAARDTADWRGRPVVDTNQLKIGVLAWVEGERAKEPERIVWQAFHLGERRNVGMGRVHEMPEGTSPAIAARQDGTFLILY